MSIENIKSALPDYARDLRLNLDSVLSEGGVPGLSFKQIHAVAIASALASRHRPLLQALVALAAGTLTVEEVDGAKAAAAIMGMNNVYYRFTHLVGDPEYATLRAGPRMNVMGDPGIDKDSFELASLAVSAINGCGTCMASHEKTLRQHGFTAQATQSAVRIGAVIHAVAVVAEQTAA